MSINLTDVAIVSKEYISQIKKIRQMLTQSGGEKWVISLFHETYSRNWLRNTLNIFNNVSGNAGEILKWETQ